MGCNSSYLDPTQVEINRKKVSKHIVFVNDKLGIDTPKAIRDAAEHVYGEPVDLDFVVEYLCSRLDGLTTEQRNEIIYDARSKKSRNLADWWEEHIEADRKRLVDIRERALAKLTLEEKKALGYD